MHSIPAIAPVAVSVTDNQRRAQREPLAADNLVTDSATLGTGQPACGVEITEHGAAACRQSWFSERVHIAPADDVENYLADVWYIGGGWRPSVWARSMTTPRLLLEARP